MATDLTLVIANKTYSSWSLRPWLAMTHFDVPFKEIVVPLHQGATSAKILTHSPAGKVPILHHGDITVWESLAILEYLAESFYDRVWWPTDPHAKAHARTIAAEMHAGFGALRQAMPMNLGMVYPARTWAEDVTKDIGRVQEIWRDARDRFGGKGDFLFGAFTISDAMYAPVITRFKTYAIDMDEACAAYADAVLALPAMKKWTAEAVEEPWVIDKYGPPD
ncbi:MAG: glutathione S-transferase family protein [Rhodospirillaceae bacterium]|nr:glutathione S-transferase family protein [Rhodospirillaceae bacterium]